MTFSFEKYSMLHPARSHRGFSLVEVLVGIGVFFLFAIGIYGSIQLVFKVVYQSRVRMLETAILNEQMELLRNVPYAQLGVVSSTPSGVLMKTVTTTRNNILFTITRTVRNVDDPFDGTVTSTPADTSPADYKFVEIAVACTTCPHLQPVSMATAIAPPYTETEQTTGVLTIHVIDANAQPVSGATVRIVATSTDMTDVTDVNGLLRVIGLSPATQAYQVTVTKAGYTSDGSTASSTSNPNPVKPYLSVVAQQETNATFTIDRLSTLTLRTVNDTCQPIGSVAVHVAGAKLLGTNPDMLLVTTTVTTNGSGVYSTTAFPWDTYSVSPRSYDLLGAIPGLPVVLPAGATQPLDLLLGDNTDHSLLIHVRDSVNLQPISSASVSVTTTDFAATKTTGIGHIAQTDWSGGSGQLDMVSSSKYWESDAGISVSAGGDVTLSHVDSVYVEDGILESSIFDVGTVADFVSIEWEPQSQPPQTGANAVRFQIAASSSSTPDTWTYVGWDGTSNTYYDATHLSVHDSLDGKRYVRYKLFLHTESTAWTPTVSSLSLSYTTSCTPPGQAYFGDLSEQTYTVTVSSTGYQTVTQAIPVDGDGYVVVDVHAE